MKTKKTAIETKKTFYSNLRNKLSSVTSQLDKFYGISNSGVFNTTTRDTANKLFSAKKVSSNAAEYVTATADSDAIASPNSIRVKRLASNDMLFSKQITNADLAGIPAGEVKYTFRVRDEEVKDTEPIEKQYKNVDLIVAFDGKETKEGAIKKIANAINANDEINMTASFMKDTSKTGRLTLSSKYSGEEYKMDIAAFNAGADPAKQAVSELLGLSNLGADRNAGDSDVNKAHFRTVSTSDLNSKFSVNGLDIVRSSNTVSDVIPGLTLNFLKVHPDDKPDATIATELDADKVISTVTPLIDAYNEVVKLLSSDKTVLRGDSSLSGLQSQIRSLVTQSIEPLKADKSGTIAKEMAPKFLTDMGFKIAKDGTLSLNDKKKFTDILTSEDGERKIADFFTSENGFASKLNKVIEYITKDDGLIDTRNESFNRQLEVNKTKTTELQTRIDKAAESMRKQYTSLLDSYNKAQNQYSSYGSLIRSSGY
jgi:flagellar hook-associated protein 2